MSGTIDRAALESALAQIRAHVSANGPPGSNWLIVLSAAEAHLETLPKPPRMVEVWRVEYCVVNGSREPDSPRWRAGIWTYLTKAEAEAEVAGIKDSRDFIAVHVTGPHLQEVPS